MKIIEDLVERTLSSMSPAERSDLIVRVVEHMLAEMDAAERLTLMEHVVDRFMDGLAPEERQATARELVPRLLAQLMQSGGMSVDDLLWAAMGSLGALEGKASQGAGTGERPVRPPDAGPGSTHPG